MYQNQGNSIGTLLRLIQEEKASNQANVMPGADPSSPIRQTVTEPIRTPESPGSERVVSIRPESAIQQGPSGVVGPQAIGPLVQAPSAVVAPRGPTPVPTPTQPMSQTPSGSTSQPSGGGSLSSSPSSSPTKSVAGVSTSRPNIGTTITNQPKIDNRPAGVKNILDYNKNIYTPQRASYGGRTVEQLTPTPKPGQDKYVPGKGWQKPSGEFYKKDTWGVS